MILTYFIKIRTINDDEITISHICHYLMNAFYKLIISYIINYMILIYYYANYLFKKISSTKLNDLVHLNTSLTKNRSGIYRANLKFSVDKTTQISYFIIFKVTYFIVII